ncbi:hypothetical protein J537_2404 [Acinetobacter baumannii 1437282]|nr:hypothetical protein J537_2404 [Acinetobacter baumannii 1437282]
MEMGINIKKYDLAESYFYLRCLKTGMALKYLWLKNKHYFFIGKVARNSLVNFL